MVLIKHFNRTLPFHYSSFNMNIFKQYICLFAAESKKIKEHVTNVQKYLKTAFQGIKVKNRKYRK